MKNTGGKWMSFFFFLFFIINFHLIKGGDISGSHTYIYPSRRSLFVVTFFFFFSFLLSMALK